MAMPFADKEQERAWKAQNYQEKKAEYRARSKAAREKVFAKIAELKKDPCVDCGVSYPHYVMQFDHIGTDKVNSISNLATRASWAKILEEIAKCELVCANCHAERTYQRRAVVEFGSIQGS